MLQEAPPSTERRDFEKHDFRITEDNILFSCGWGIAPGELTQNNRSITSEFGEVSKPHLPHGFSNICDAGKENGVNQSQDLVS